MRPWGPRLYCHKSIITCTYTVEDKIKFTFRLRFVSFNDRLKKLQQNDPVEKNEEKNDINTAILSTGQQCKLLFNKFYLGTIIVGKESIEMVYSAYLIVRDIN